MKRVGLGAVPSGSDRLHQTVVNALGRAIVTGDLRFNAVLSPDALAAELNVSKSVLREAFRVLQAKGLITARPRVGTRVADPSVWNYLDSDVIGWRLISADRDAQVAELYATRYAIEPVATRAIALGTAGEGSLDELDSLIDAMRLAWEDKDIHGFTEADIAFHVAILEMSGNRMFAQLRDVIASAVRIRETLVFPLEANLLAGLEAHRTLVERMRQKDASAEEVARSIIVDANAETLHFLEPRS